MTRRRCHRKVHLRLRYHICLQGIGCLPLLRQTIHQAEFLKFIIHNESFQFIKIVLCFIMVCFHSHFQVNSKDCLATSVEILVVMISANKSRHRDICPVRIFVFGYPNGSVVSDSSMYWVGWTHLYVKYPRVQFFENPKHVSVK